MPIIDNGGCCIPKATAKTNANTATSAAHHSIVPATHQAQPAIATQSPPAAGGVLLASAAIIALLSS